MAEAVCWLYVSPLAWHSCFISDNVFSLVRHRQRRLVYTVNSKYSVAESKIHETTSHKIDYLAPSSEWFNRRHSQTEKKLAQEIVYFIFS
jgi:hypothetical protein